MTALLRKFCFVMFLLLPTFALANSSTVTTEHTRATLIAEDRAIVAGEALYLGLKLELKPGWHTYWTNPGDAGAPTQLHWTLPAGFSAGAIQWPAPERIETPPLVSFGYKNAVTLPVVMTPPETLTERSYTFSVKAEWLVCENICIPESGDFTLTLPVETKRLPSDAAPEFDAVRAQLPVYVWSQYARLYQHETHYEMVLPLDIAGVTQADHAFFFPVREGWMESAADQKFRIENGNILLTLPQAKNVQALPQNVEGVIQITSAQHTSHLHFSFTPERPVPGSTLSFSKALWFAFLGGLILNIMPCVFPVLSLKALSLVGTSRKQRTQLTLNALAYTLGIVMSFTVFAVILAAIKNAGISEGWGFHMQSPVFIGVMTLMMFLVGLNLSGAFELPVLFGNHGHSLTSRSDTMGSFFTGVLAVLVASPCTAPFMAPALGYAFTQPSHSAWLFFVMLGLGLASPYLLISLVPRLAEMLPRPGVWMLHFKQFLAFPMYLSAAWLVWVLAKQLGVGAVFIMSILLVLAAFAVWALSFRMRTLRRSIILIIILCMAWIGFDALHRMEPQLSSDAATIAFSGERLSSLRAENKKVFVDVTAAWCITCQTNKLVALNTPEIRDYFKSKDITVLTADWTTRDATITHYMETFGRTGVPLYVYYPERGDPVVLPQILTPSIVKEYAQ